MDNIPNRDGKDSTGLLPACRLVGEVDSICIIHSGGVVCNDCCISVCELRILLILTCSDYYRFQLTAFLIDSLIVFGAQGLNSLGQYPSFIVLDG